jgi:hypothetical protein
VANYEIHIQDVDNVEDDLILHYAERDAIELNWLGGDSKTQPIVGSELNFTLEATDAKDAAFIELFTADENKWLVTKRISTTQEIVWQGYLLPESYEEPYRRGIFYVNFSAVDGLGLLKGLKLSPDFYNEEKTVIEVLCAILKLTKVDLELYFSPALININEPDWSKILVDTMLWDFNKDNAYQLLKDLLESMRCQVYQCQGKWFIEGFNKRQLINVSYQVFDLEANFLRDEDFERTVKQIPLLADPSVRMVPSIREAVVTYERNQLQFPEDIIQENEVPWVIYRGQLDALWRPKNWNYKFDSVDSEAIINPPEFYLVINRIDEELDTSKFITLREKLFVKKNSTIKIKLKIKRLFYDDLSDEDLAGADFTLWSKSQIYEVLLNGEVIVTNLNVSQNDQAYLKFENGEASVELIIKPEEDGLLDLKFYKPFSVFDVGSDYRGTEFKELSIEVVPEIQDEIYIIENGELGSNISEIDLRFGDDPTLFTEAFYLERTRELVGNNEANRFFLPVKYYTEKDGITYAIVLLQAAVMAYRLRFSENKIFHVNGPNVLTGEILNDPNIIFNYEDGESAAIEVNQSLTDGHIFINYSRYKEETRSRNEITSWSDAIFVVEDKRFGQIVGEIEKKIYETPHFSFEGATDSPLKYNDILKIQYNDEQRYFTLSNCTWMPDDNTSEFIANEMLYQGANSELIPPFVDAGPDIIIGVNDSVSFLSAVANAPSGTIEIIQWEQVSANGNANIYTPGNLQTEVDQLSLDYYTFRITVTDSNGLSAFDEVNVIRVSDSTLTLVETERGGDESDDGMEMTEFFYYEVNLTPDLTGDESVSVTFDMLLDIFSTNYQSTTLFASIEIIKNGISIFGSVIRQSDMNSSSLTSLIEDSVFSINATDNVTIELVTQAIVVGQSDNEQAQAFAKITLKSAVFADAERQITNLPISEEVRAIVSS